VNEDTDAPRRPSSHDSPRLLVLAAALAAVACAAPAGADTRDRIGEVLAGRPLILYGASAEEAAAVRAMRALDGAEIPVLAAAEATDAQLAGRDLLVFGTPWSNPFLARCLAGTPLALTPGSVTVGDATYAGTDVRLVAALPHPLDPGRRCVVLAAQDEALLRGIIRGIGGADGEGDFVVYRKSDGLYHEDEHLAVGSLVVRDGAVALGTVRHHPKPPRRLDTLVEGGVRLHYDTFTPDEAHTLARAVEVMRRTAADEFGLPMPDPLHVYAYAGELNVRRVHIYTDAFDTFWFKMPDPKEDFLARGQSLVAMAHETARLAFQPQNANREKQGPLRFWNDDWSHYFQFTVLIPALAAQLGEAAWPVPLDYAEAWGRPLFDRMYRGCADTYASLLLELEVRLGRPAIGAAVRELTHDSLRRDVDISAFMDHLATATGEAELQRRVAAALPTPMEHSLARRIEPLGFVPDLDEMLWQHRFTVGRVPAGGAAEGAGLRPGDRLLRIDGFDLQAAKARAVRHLLDRAGRAGEIALVVERNGREVHLGLPLRPRGAP
jgi:hypothetical protein